MIDSCERRFFRVEAEVRGDNGGVKPFVVMEKALDEKLSEIEDEAEAVLGELSLA